MRGSIEAMFALPVFKEFTISFESPSRIASMRPISCPNSRARTAAIASISTGWSAWRILWVKDARIAPVCVQTTTPILLLFSSLKIVPSKFILTKLASSGFHLSFGFTGAGRVGGSTAKYSASFSFTCNVSWSDMQQALLFQTWLRWCQIPHVTVAKSSLFLWFVSTQDSSSLKLVTPDVCWELHSVCVHTESSSLQVHNAWSTVSSSFLHLLHRLFSVMCLHFRLAFMGMASRQARHKKFFTLLGILIP